MDIKTAFAAQGYAAAKTTAAPVAEIGLPENGGGGAFLGMATSFIDTLNTAESTARAAMTGKADPHALIEALAASQTAVETVVTVRDKVVEAYQEILRMPV